MVAGVKMPGIGGVFGILNDFRELSCCGPCGPFFYMNGLGFYTNKLNTVKGFFKIKITQKKFLDSL